MLRASGAASTLQCGAVSPRIGTLAYARRCRPSFLPLRGGDLARGGPNGCLPFFQGAAFDDDATQVMGKAFDACQSVHDNGQRDLVRQIIAQRIIEVARKGERDPDELCARALQALGFRIRQIA
jgi:hypothetical protein